MRSRTLRRAAWATPVLALVAVVLLLFALAGWDVRYATRVLWHRDSDITDVGWKAHTSVAATAPRPWPTGPCPVVGLPTEDTTRSVVVVHRGALVCQWYGNAGAPHTPAASFSVSKTVLSLLVARAVADGTLPGYDMPVTDAIPELAQRDPRFTAVTLGQLLDMRSGIAFSEDVPFPWVDQDQPAVYYATDLERTVVQRPVVETPPGPFTYNDYGPNLVGLAHRRLTGELLTGPPLQRLWADLGAEDPALWTVDDKGFPYHESGLVVTAPDLARVGQAVLDGRVPSQFLARSAVASEPALTYDGVDVGYRNGWWLLPGGDLAAMGDHGQIMVVCFSTGTVVVRMGEDDGPNVALALRLQQLAQRVTD